MYISIFRLGVLTCMYRAQHKKDSKEINSKGKECSNMPRRDIAIQMSNIRLLTKPLLKRNMTKWLACYSDNILNLKKHLGQPDVPFYSTKND